MEDQEVDPLLADNEGAKITLKDLWLDVQFWNLNLVDVCELANPPIKVRH